MKKAISVVLTLCMFLSLLVLPTTVSAQTEEVVDCSFRELEKSNDLNSSGINRAISTARFTQGAASLECTATEGTANGNFFVYFYRLGQKNNPLDISGATHITMDIWVPTDGLLDTIAGDAGINVDDVDHMNKWGDSAGKVSASAVKAALKGLKAGWNFVSFPLSAPSTSQTAADIRFYMIKSGLAEGTKIYIDDVRFVNQAALDTVAADRNAAKEVIGLLSEGQTDEAAAAYNGLLHRQRVYVPETLLTAQGITPIPATNRYTASFDLDGGAPAFDLQEVYVGDTLRAVSRPAKEGYAFGGWYVEGTKVDLATFTMPEKDVTLTAKWVSPVTLSFDVNGGKTEIEPQVLAEGETPAPVEDPRRGGHRFDGWYNGDTKVDLESLVMGKEDITLTAKWLPYRYFLKFNANGGLDINPYQVVECAHTPDTLPVTPLREGYVFDGWYNGMKKVDFATFTMPDSDVTLNAKWKRGDATLAFGNVNGDTLVNAADALEILKRTVGKVEFNTDQTFYGDVNTDGLGNAKDALLVLQYTVQKISIFPAAEHYAALTQPLPPASGPIYPGDPVPQPGDTPVDPPPSTPTPVEMELDIMTFNIRQSGNNNELDGDNGWLNRKSAVMEYLNNSGMDVLFLQEVRKSQSEDISALLSEDYKGVYKGRENIANPEGLMTLYNAKKFELVSNEVFWLSETPEEVSKGWGANYYRICLVVTLKEKETGKLINLFNLHLDHQVELARVNGLKLVMERLAAKEGHAIVAGDFNTTSASGCYDIIADQMTDTSTAPGAKVFSTCQEFGAGAGNQNGSPIDFIFVNKADTTLKSYRICNDTFTDEAGTLRNYSDHYAVQSTVLFTYR